MTPQETSRWLAAGLLILAVVLTLAGAADAEVLALAGIGFAVLSRR